MEGLGLAAFAVTPAEIAQRKTFVFIGSVCMTARQAYEACDAHVGAAAVADRNARSGEESLESDAMPAEECSSWALDCTTTLRDAPKRLA